MKIKRKIASSRWVKKVILNLIGLKIIHYGQFVKTTINLKIIRIDLKFTKVLNRNKGFTKIIFIRKKIVWNGKIKYKLRT